MSLLQSRRAAKRRSETIQLFALLAVVLLTVVGMGIGASTGSYPAMLLGGLPGAVLWAVWFLVYRPER